MKAPHQSTIPPRRRFAFWKPRLCLACGTISAVVSLLASPCARAANDAFSTAPAITGNAPNFTLGTTTPAFGDALYFGTSNFTTLNNDLTGYSFVLTNAPIYPGGDTGFVLELAPVPEPSTWVACGVGLLAVGCFARRKRLTANA